MDKRPKKSNKNIRKIIGTNTDAKQQQLFFGGGGSPKGKQILDGIGETQNVYFLRPTASPIEC